jgi:hypothetical protein
LYESQSQAGAQVCGARAQPMSALRTFARILPEISALPPLFPQSGACRGNPGSDQIELVNRLTIYDLRLAIKNNSEGFQSSIVNRQSQID